MEDVSEGLYKLRPVRFFYNEDAIVRAEEFGIRQYGFIAEEVQKIFPELVGEFQGEIFGVKYDLLAPLLVQEVQKQNKRLIALEENDITIEDLKADNKTMGSIIDNLMSRIQQLESRIN